MSRLSSRFFVAGFFAVLVLFSGVAGAITIDTIKVGATRFYPVASPMMRVVAPAFRAFPYISTALTIGELLSKISLEDPTTGNPVDIYARDQPVATPDGWTDANTPPSQHPFFYSYVGDGIGTGAFSTPAALCASVNTYVTQSCGNPAGYYMCMGSNGCMNAATIRRNQYCDAGYHSDQAKCVLDTPSIVKWPSDNVPTLVSNGTQLVPHSRDPDTVTFLPSSTPSTGETSITQKGPDDKGNPAQTVIKPTADGGYDWRRPQESQDPTTGLPNVQTISVHVDNSGHITSSSTVVTNNTTLDNSVSSVGTGVSNTTSNVTGDALLEDVGAPYKLLPTPESFDSSSDRLIDGIKAMEILQAVNSAKSISVGTGQCPPLTMDTGAAWFGVLSTTVHCDIFESLRGVIGTISLAIFGIAAVFIVMGA